MYIYYITRYYTKISLSTLQYYTMYCKNTKYTVYPRMFLLQLFASVHLAHSTVQIEFSGGFTRPHVTTWGKRTIRTANLGQSLCTTVCRSGGDCKEFNFTFTFKIQLANERLGKWHFIQEGDGKYLSLQRKNLLSDPGKQIFCLFWIECNIFPTIARSKYNIFCLEIYKMPIV